MTTEQLIVLFGELFLFLAWITFAENKIDKLQKENKELKKQLEQNKELKKEQQ